MPDALHAGNLFADAAPLDTGERFETLIRRRNLVVERIVSSEALTPTEYVQEQDEWVVLLRGAATLRVNGEVHHLTAGDYLFLPARTPHVVEQTSDGALWLAVHLHPNPPGSPRLGPEAEGAG